MALGTYVPALVAALLGVGSGYFISRQMGSKKAEHLDDKIDQNLAAAKEKIQTLKAETEREVQELHEKSEKEADARRNQIIELEHRVSERETKLETKIESVEQKEQELASTRELVEKDRAKLATALEEEQKHLTEISQRNHKFFIPIRGINIHDVPKDRLPADFDHRFGFDRCFFGEARA